MKIKERSRLSAFVVLSYYEKKPIVVEDKKMANKINELAETLNLKIKEPIISTSGATSKSFPFFQGN